MKNILFLFILFSPLFLAGEDELLGMSWTIDKHIIYIESSKDLAYFELRDVGVAAPFFSYGQKSSYSDKKLHCCSEKADSKAYYLKTPRHCSKASPTKIAKEDIFLEPKRFIFYTGAGLSRAAGIPIMRELEDCLGLRTQDWLTNIQVFPDELLDKIHDFWRACFLTNPTIAHLELKTICQAFDTPLFTENLDALHEKSGWLPHRIDAPSFSKAWEGDFFQSIDLVICLGLSQDDKGFLAWYKTQNPKGKILAVNFSMPTYLGSEDLWCQEDVQLLLPYLRQRYVLHLQP